MLTQYFGNFDRLAFNFHDLALQRNIDGIPDLMGNDIKLEIKGINNSDNQTLSTLAKNFPIVSGSNMEISFRNEDSD